MAWNEPGKGRDPWGGGNGSQPPDIDEIMRKMQRRFGGMFGGGDGSGLFGLIGLIVVALLAYEMFHVIGPSERGVVLRFGQHVTTLEPGPALRFPRPIERVLRVNVEEVEQFAHKALMLTQDENIIDVELGVQYRRTSAADFLFNVIDPDRTLGQAAESAVREIAGKTTMDFVLGAGRAEVAASTQALLQSTLDQYQAGITVLAVNLVDAQPPEPVQAAFEDAIKSREDQERLINEAQAYANDVLPRARGAAARVMEEANAYRESTIARATGETSRFLQILTEYERAPAVTRERLYIEAIEAVLASSNKVLIDIDGAGNLMYLPLDQLLKGTGVTPPLTEAQRDTRSPGSAGSSGDRGRDDGRGRRAP